MVRTAENDSNWIRAYRRSSSNDQSHFPDIGPKIVTSYPIGLNVPKSNVSPQSLAKPVTPELPAVLRHIEQPNTNPQTAATLKKFGFETPVFAGPDTPDNLQRLLELDWNQFTRASDIPQAEQTALAQAIIDFADQQLQAAKAVNDELKSIDEGYETDYGLAVRKETAGWNSKSDSTKIQFLEQRIEETRHQYLEVKTKNQSYVMNKHEGDRLVIELQSKNGDRLSLSTGERETTGMIISPSGKTPIHLTMIPNINFPQT